jgi:hypothetical protein
MKAYTVRTVIPCYVTFVYRVRAEDEAEAVDHFLGSGAEFVCQEVGETISFLDHSGFEVEEADPGVGEVSAHASPLTPRASNYPASKPYSVLLLYPDYANHSGTETYYTFVEAPGPFDAVTVARRQAIAAQEGVAIDPIDFDPLLVIEGHHHSKALFNK